MILPSLAAPLSPEPTAVVGRLRPLPGVVQREHPDRQLLRRFLSELQLPLAAMQSLLELVPQPAIDPSSGVAMRACVEHVEHLLGLVRDFGDCGALEMGQVQPVAAPVALQPWLASTLAKLAIAADRLQIEPQLLHRSFLPDHIVIDGGLAARAVTAVMGVAMQRSLPGPLQVSVAYEHDRQTPAASRLVLEFCGRGGGFLEIEQGYVFQPFNVRDAAARPWLGLSVGQALCELLGGRLRIRSPGLRSATYTIELPATPSAAAMWIDPMADGHFTFGTVD